MSIAELKKNESLDLVRIDRNSVEVALKRIFIKVLLTDGAAKKIYGPILFPLYWSSLAVLLLDHLRLIYIEKDFNTKVQSLSEKTDSYTLNKMTSEITPEAIEKLKSFGEIYHRDIGTRPPEAFKKIWPKGLTAPFTGFYQDLERLTPPNKNFDNVSDADVEVTLKDGSTKVVPSWKIGALVHFGESILASVFQVWMEELDGKIKRKYIFSNPELLQDSLKKMLFDPNFYLTIYLQQNEIEKANFSEENAVEYANTASQHWKANLKEKLASCKSANPEKDVFEQELFIQVEEILEKYKEKNLPSREFEIDFSNCFMEYKNRKIANRIRLLIEDPSFITLIQALPEFKFSDDKRESANEITLLFEAIMTNNTDKLDKFADQEFANKIKAFLKKWGGPLKSLRQQKISIGVVTKLIEWGFFKGSISSVLQKAFKLPVDVSDLPRMLEGMRELPDKNLVELFRGFSNDPEIAKAADMELIRSLLNDSQSPIADKLETFMFDEEFLNNHFDVLNGLTINTLKKKNRSSKEMKKFINVIIQLTKSDNFFESFNKHWADKSGFKESLTAVVINPDLYKNYDLFISFVCFKLFKLNKNDEVALIQKARRSIYTIYDYPTLHAAVKIKEGGKYDSSALVPTDNDSDFQKLVKALKFFGAEGKIKDHKGSDILYREALAGMDLSFVDFDATGEVDLSGITQSSSSEKIFKASQEFLLKEVENLVTFMPIFTEGKQKLETRELWHFVLRLAIETESVKYMKICLEMIESLGAFTSADVTKHYNFILKNKKMKICEMMLSHVAKKQDKGCEGLIAQMIGGISDPNKDKAVKIPRTISQGDNAIKQRSISISKSNSKKDFKLSQDSKIATAKLFAKVQEQTVSVLQASISKYLSKPSSGNVTEFLKWIFDNNNPLFNDYLQVTSVTNTVKLEVAQFSQLLLNMEDLAKVLPSLATLNAYFYTEVFPDHFAMGLATNSQNEKSEDYKSKLLGLSAYNQIMLEVLNDKKTTKELKSQDYEKFSIYQQSLAPKEMEKFAIAYQTEHKNDSNIQKDVEFSLFSMLKLNIGICRGLLESLKESPLYSLMQKGLIARYSAVEQLIHHYKELTLSKSLELGTQTILVAPTLIYGIAAINQTKPINKLQQVIDDESLEKAVYTAALLVRLLNDIGTTPLLNPIGSLDKLRESLKSIKEKDFIAKLGENTDVEWSRIVKDIKFGEHNVGLDSVRGIAEPSKAWKKLKGNIKHFSKVYEENKLELIASIEKIDSITGDKNPGMLIRNFVLFHEELYSKNAMTKEGEYAIAESIEK